MKKNHEYIKNLFVRKDLVVVMMTLVVLSVVSVGDEHRLEFDAELLELLLTVGFV